MPRERITHYLADRLHDRHEAAFAVISMPSGAIALRANGRPIMKLTEAAAIRIASAKTAEITRAKRDRLSQTSRRAGGAAAGRSGAPF